MQNKVIYAGSFDPLHEGHLFVIDSAIKLFDKVYLVVADNSDKRGKEFISFSDRIRLIGKVMRRKYPTVEVIRLKDRFIADFAKENEIKYIIRGLRNSDDFNQEKVMSRVNAEIGDNLQTVFVMSPVELNSYSSNLIRGFVGLINWEEKIQKMVPEEVYEHILFSHKGGFHKFMDSILCCTDVEKSKYGDIEFNDLIGNIFKNLHTAYTNKSERHYHDLKHILFMIHELDEINLSRLLEKDKIDLTSDDIDILKIAIWGHDYIYVPGDEDNEILSADRLSADLLKLEIDSSKVQKIHNLITITKHNKDTDDSLEKLICDLDMLLGGKSNIEEWLTTTRKIRTEYEKFDNKEWMTGRILFLESMLAKERIYKTNYFRDRYESTIRKNMTIELKNLKAYTEEDWSKKEKFD